MDVDTGRTRIFTNSRDRFGGLRPFWKKATATHGGVGQDDAWMRIKFARLFDRDRGTRSDYVRLVMEKMTEDFYHFFFEVRENLGTGGTRMKADGNRYCDMTGTGK